MVRLFLLLSLLLSGCSTPTKEDVVAKYNDKAQAEETKMLESISPPDWAFKQPVIDNVTASFVGVGDPSPNEKRARTSAINDAIASMMKYAGIRLSVFTSYAKNTHGQSGLSYNSNNSVKSFGESFVSDVAVSDFYTVKKNGNYIVKVLIEIPQEQIEKIREYNRLMNTPVKLTAIGVGVEPINDNIELSKYKAKSVAEAYASAELAKKINGSTVSSTNGAEGSSVKVVSYGNIKNSTIEKEEFYIQNGSIYYKVYVSTLVKREGDYDIR